MTFSTFSSNTKYLRWSKNGVIYWEELLAAPEMNCPAAITPEGKAEQREQAKQRNLIEDAERAADILNPGESMPAAEFRRAIIGKPGITSKDRVETILAACTAQGFLIKREPTKEEKISSATRAIIERPAEPPEAPEQPDFFQSPQI